MNSLYQITDEIKKIEEELLEAEGEITPEQEALIESLGALLVNKTDNCADFMRSQIDFISAIEKRVDELTEMKKRVEVKMDKFNQYVMDCMTKLELKKIEGEFNKIMLPKPSDVLEVTDEEKIPLEFLKVKKTVSVDKMAIKKLIKNGEKIEGAKLIPGKQRVNYKNK